MMSLKTWAWVFAVVFILVGILGFVPGITSNGHLLGIFEVDALHNVIHLLSGIVALVVAMGSMKWQKLYFQVFGVVYAVVTVVGFAMGGSILGLFMVNMADNVLHLAIALVSLWLGFAMKEKPMMSAAPMGGTM